MCQWLRRYKSLSNRHTGGTGKKQHTSLDFSYSVLLGQLPCEAESEKQTSPLRNPNTGMHANYCTTPSTLLPLFLTHTNTSGPFCTTSCLSGHAQVSRSSHAWKFCVAITVTCNFSLQWKRVVLADTVTKQCNLKLKTIMTNKHTMWSEIFIFTFKEPKAGSLAANEH